MPKVVFIGKKTTNKLISTHWLGQFTQLNHDPPKEITIHPNAIFLTRIGTPNPFVAAIGHVTARLWFVGCFFGRTVCKFCVVQECGRQR